MYQEIVSAIPENIELEDVPIPREWILSGDPESRVKRLGKNGEWTAVLWECSAGRFSWTYPEDEAILIIDGEIFQMIDGATERRLGPGDVGIFPAGTVCKWRIDRYLKKVAILRQRQPGPVAFVLNLWTRLQRALGLLKESRLDRALNAFATQNADKFANKNAQFSHRQQLRLTRATHA
jgi:uncharacterized cupin superfamily protein